MCMDRILKEKPKPGGVGYKAFSLRGDKKLYGEFAGLDKPRPRGRWLKATNYPPLGKERARMATLSYPPGWHIFKTKAGIRYWMGTPDDSWTIRKVKYQGAFIAGSYYGYPQVVAAEIKILPLKRS